MERAVYFWDLATGERESGVIMLENTVNDLAVSPSGTHLFTAAGRNLQCWELPERTLRGHYQNQSVIKTMCLDATGILALGDVSGKLHVLDLLGRVDAGWASPVP